MIGSVDLLGDVVLRRYVLVNALLYCRGIYFIFDLLLACASEDLADTPGDLTAKLENQTIKMVKATWAELKCLTAVSLVTLTSLNFSD